jgi:hypothetical protein
MDFITQLFAALQQQRHQPLDPSQPPRWLATRYARASTIALRDG